MVKVGSIVRAKVKRTVRDLGILGVREGIVEYVDSTGIVRRIGSSRFEVIEEIESGDIQEFMDIAVQIKEAEDKVKEYSELRGELIGRLEEKRDRLSVGRGVLEAEAFKNRLENYVNEITGKGLLLRGYEVRHYKEWESVKGFDVFRFRFVREAGSFLHYNYIKDENGKEHLDVNSKYYTEMLRYWDRCSKLNIAKLCFKNFDIAERSVIKHHEKNDNIQYINDIVIRVWDTELSEAMVQEICNSLGLRRVV